MATQAQFDASRSNAQKSTGPRTPEGKARSRRNALKTGLSASALMISGEDSREMAQIGQDYIRMFTPANAFQRFHLENIIYCEWMIRRCRRIEAELINHLMMKDRSVPYEVAAGCAYQRDAAGANALQKVHRRMNSLEKSYYRSLAELEASGARFDRGAEPDPASAPDQNNEFDYDPESGKFYYPAPQSAESHAAPESEPDTGAAAELPAPPKSASPDPEKPAPPDPSSDSASGIGFVLSTSEKAASSAKLPDPTPAGTPGSAPTPRRRPSSHSPQRPR